MAGTMRREAVGRQGPAAEPDVVSLPAFRAAVTTPAGVGGLDRRTTRFFVVGRIPKLAGNAARLGGARRQRPDSMRLRPDDSDASVFEVDHATPTVCHR